MIYIYICIIINNHPIVPSPWNFHLHEARAPASLRARCEDGSLLEVEKMDLPRTGHGDIRAALVTIAGWWDGVMGIDAIEKIG